MEKLELFKTPEDIPDDALGFLSRYMNEKDFTVLRKKLATFSTSTSQFHRYLCIQNFLFITPKMPRYPLYKEMLENLKATEKDDKILDVGCCFGQDIRNLLLDGVPSNKIVALDVHDGYWNLSKELFGDKDKISDIKFVTCDLTSTRIESFESYFKYITLTSVLHVLDKEGIENVLKNVFFMLKAGGIAMGFNSGHKSEATLCEDRMTPDGKKHRFLHCPDSLKHLLTEIGFVNVKVYAFNRDSLVTTDEKALGNARLLWIAAKK